MVFPASLPSAEAVEGFTTLHVPAHFGFLKVIRQSVTEVGERSGLGNRFTAQLEMAVDEACSNIIEHSYGSPPGVDPNLDQPKLRLHMIRRKDRIEIEIFDKGSGFDMEHQTPIVPEDYIDPRRVRGLGLYIINHFVDEVQYLRHTPSGNCLRLTKRFE